MKLYRPTLQKQPKTAKGYVACMTDQPHPADNEWNGRESREWVKFTDHAADLARADARIAELEQSVTVRDAEIARLETDLELARIGARRYETVRRMGAHQWGDAHSLNLLTGKPLDQIIDELRPFMFPQEARAGNGGGS